MKKLISTLLTIAMLLSLVPAAFAADTTTLEKSMVKIVYDLSAHMESLAYGSAGGATLMTDINNELTDGFYSFLSNPADSTHYESSAQATFGYKALSSLKKRFVDFTNGAKVSFEIFVPKAGKYDFEMYNYLNYNSNIKDKDVNVYLSERVISTDAEDKVGTYTCYTDIEEKNNTIPETPSKVGEVEISKPGNYIVTFTTPDSPRWHYNNIGTFVLNGGGNLVPMMSTCEIADDTLAVGENAQITAEAKKLSDGSDATGVTYSYASAENNIAEVDENGNVTANAVGNTEITVTASCNGQSASKVIPVSVIPDGAAGINLTYNFSSLMIDWKDTNPGFAKLTYDATYDLNNYFANSENHLGHDSTNEYYKGSQTDTSGKKRGLQIAKSGSWYAATIRVPVSGKYIASVDYAKFGRSTGYLGVYLFAKNEELSISEISRMLTTNNMLNKVYEVDSSITGNAAVWQDEPAELKIVDLKAGEYYLVFRQEDGGSYAWFGDFYLNGYGDGVAPIITDCSVPKTILEENESVDITSDVRYLTDGNAVSNVVYTYESSDKNVADVENGRITAKNGGNATITVSATADGATLPGTRTIDLTVNTSEYTEAFGAENNYKTEVVTNLNPEVGTAAYADGNPLAGAENDATKNSDGTYSVKTAETVGDYTFRYWVRGLENNANGNKRIVSLENNFTYAPQKGDKNWLIAVYTKNGTATPEYFNANGQLIVGATDASRPVMPGYGEAIDWKDHGNGIKEAVYGNIQSYQITVNDETKTYNYGERVSYTAAAEKDDQHFLGWTKKRDGEESAELVSAELTYTFYAWEKCTVTAVYTDNKPVFAGEKRKILVDTFSLGGETAVMAEFIGFGDAVERGITLGTKDYTMSSKEATQFTIINDVGAVEISGYAILADGTKFVYNLK